MKRRILFSVVSTLLVYYISFQPVSGNGGSTSAETETGIFESFLRKHGCGGKKIEELTHSEIGRAVQFLEDKVREEKNHVHEERNRTLEERNRTLEERKLRLIFQSMINIGEWVESLFANCWPSWAGARIPKQYPKEHWRILLLNIEEDQIFNLKLQLEELQISNELFVKTVEELLQLRNVKAQSKMSHEDKEEAIQLLNKQYEAKKKPEVIKVLMLGLNEPILPTSNEDEKLTLQANVKATTEKDRNSFRVFHFPKCKSPLCKEDAVALQLKKAADAYKMAKNDGNDDGVINPPAVVATTNGTFALFESFKDAYSIWCTRNKMEFAIGEMDELRIIDADELTVFKGKENEPTHLVVKVESKSRETIAATYEVISNKAFDYQPLESFIQQPAGSQPAGDDTISALYCYGSAKKALSTYAELKKTIDKSTNNVTLTCIPKKQTTNMNILNDAVVTELRKQQQ